MELIIIDINELRSFLSGLDSVTGEFELVKKFTPDSGSDGAPYSMYERHFSVYHALYKLKFDAGRDGVYLHIDPVRIRLIPLPSTGSCGYYKIESGSFCMNRAEDRFCSEHRDEVEPEIPQFDPMAQFYLEPENITFGESDILRDVMKGFGIYMTNRREINEALKLFGIEKPGRKSISRRYRELASEFHPDRHSGSEEKMKEINRAYSLLKNVYVV